MSPREFNLLAICRRAMLSRFHLDREVGMTTLHLARVVTLILTLLVLPTALGAQSPGKVVRIGLLDFGASNPSSEARWKPLRDRLRELGYVEGRTSPSSRGGEMGR